MASQSSLTGGAGSQKQVSAVGKALLSMAKNLNEVSALLGGAETGIRSDLEIVVASRMVEYLAMDPTVDSRDTARELVSAFQRDARRMAHVSLVHGRPWSQSRSDITSVRNKQPKTFRREA